jgi:hypothetical protein
VIMALACVSVNGSMMVLAKIDVHDWAQVVVFAYRSGLITDGGIDTHR